MLKSLCNVGLVLLFHNLCYTQTTMQTDSLPDARSSWPGWAETLRRYRMDDLAAWLLEAAGPLTVLGAQALYAGGVLLRPALTDAQCGALARLLEDRDETNAFVRFLREAGLP